MFGLPAQKQKGLLGLLGTMPMNEAAPMPLQQEAMQPPPPAMQQTMQAGMQRYTQPQQPQGPKFFGEGGLGRHLAGSLGDSLMQMNGLQPLYTPMMQERRAMAQRQQLMQQQQQMELEAEARKRQAAMYDPQKIGDNIVRLNPATGKYETVFTAPRINDTIADFNWYNGLSEEDKAVYDKLHPITVMGPDGPYAVPRSALGGGQAAPSGGLKPGAVEDGYRFKGGDPADQRNWEPVGGGGGNAPGGFRPSVNGNRLDYVTVRSESSFNPNAVSPKGARGLWQVMPDTARDPGFGIKPWNGTPQDLDRVGYQYRRAMEKRYGGDLQKMWAAYNWGPGNLDNAIAKHGADWFRHAPRETRDYVNRNMRAIGGK